jgi:hypothetical protein
MALAPIALEISLVNAIKIVIVLTKIVSVTLEGPIVARKREQISLDLK